MSQNPGEPEGSGPGKLNSTNLTWLSLEPLWADPGNKGFKVRRIYVHTFITSITVPTRQLVCDQCLLRGWTWNFWGQMDVPEYPLHEGSTLGCWVWTLTWPRELSGKPRTPEHIELCLDFHLWLTRFCFFLIREWEALVDWLSPNKEQEKNSSPVHSESPSPSWW